MNTLTKIKQEPYVHSAKIYTLFQDDPLKGMCKALMPSIPTKNQGPLEVPGTYEPIKTVLLPVLLGFRV